MNTTIQYTKKENRFRLNLSMSKSVKLGQTVLDLLNSYPDTDFNLGEKIGVSRDTIHKWKTGRSANIRKSNLLTLAKALGYEPNITDGKVEFYDVLNHPEDNQHGELDLNNNDTSQLIKTLSETNSLLVDQLKSKDIDIK